MGLAQLYLVLHASRERALIKRNQEKRQRRLRLLRLIYLWVEAEKAMLRNDRLIFAHCFYMSTIRRRLFVHSSALPNPNDAAVTELLRCTHEPSWISYTGITRELFFELLPLFSEHFVREWEIEWQRHVNPEQARGRPGALYQRRTNDCRRVFVLILMYLTTSTQEKVFCQLFGTAPTTTNRYLTIALRAIWLTLKQVPDARIEWPSPAKQDEYIDMFLNKYPHIDFKPVALMDGLSLTVRESGDFFEQNAYYCGYSCETQVNNLLCYGPDGCVLYAKINYPGSSHDAWLFTDMKHQILEQPDFLPRPNVIIADTAFPRTQEMSGRVLTPLKQSDADNLVRNGARVDLIMALRACHLAIVSIRQGAEWGMRGFQGTFGRLMLPLTLDKHRRFVMLESMLRLYNLRVRRVGFSQIATVYMPLWEVCPLVRARRSAERTVPLVF